MSAPSSGAGRRRPRPAFVRGLARRGRIAVLALVVVIVGASHAASQRPGAGPTAAAARSAASTLQAPAPAACPSRPRFNSVIDTSGRTSFHYRTQQGQVILGARRRGTDRVRTLMRTPQGRSRLPRVELTTDRVVDARRLPWFAQKVGPRRVVAAILADADHRAYSGVRLAYAPRTGTFAKLILPAGSVRNGASRCRGVTGYPTIYAQNIRRGATPVAPRPATPATPSGPTPTVDVGPAFRLVLAVPRDQQEPAGAVAAMRNEADEVTAWFGRQTANNARPRWIRIASGQIDVRVVRLPKTTAQYNTDGHGAVLSDVRDTARPTEGTVVDLVWINAGIPSQHPCGVSTGRTGGATEGAVFWQSACEIVPSLNSTWPYGGTYLLAHEMTHLFGAARSCAPHHDGTGHVTDSVKDIISAIGRDWGDLQLDPGYDDYMFTNNGCDITRSPLWTVTPTRLSR